MNEVGLPPRAGVRPETIGSPELQAGQWGEDGFPGERIRGELLL